MGAFMRRVAPLAMMALLPLGCLRVSESRAERDREVGHAEAYGMKIDVDDGLAAVRSIAPGSLELWAGAPSLDIALRRDQSSPYVWTLGLHNCLPDAELTVDDEAVSRPRSILPTRCVWTFPLPPDRQVRLRVRSPRADIEAPFHFGILSDIQRAVTEVSDIFDLMNEAGDLSFVVSTGDLTNHGQAGEFDFLQQQLERLNIPFFTTLGNHELGGSPVEFHDWFGRGNFHFEFRGVHFTLLDSASGTLDPIVYDWLDDWLVQGRDHLHVVGMHIPPLDPVGLRNGGFASRNEAAKVLARLADGGVDLTFYGHIHSYYRFQNAGIEAHISGGGGGLPEQFDGIGRHYLNVEADPQSGTLSTRVVPVD
jgi:hypothetical protein